MGRPLYFEELLNTLRAAPSNTSRDAEQNLYYELERAKPKFFQLFDLPPRNAKEKQDIEAGVAKLHGQSTVSHFNQTFKNETLFLAQQLNCSELYCAGLIDDVAVLDKFGRRAKAEDAVARLHDERVFLLACLRYIFETAMNPAGLSPRLATIIRKYALELITSPCELGDGKGKGRLGEKMLLEIDRLSRAMDAIQGALVNAPTATTATSFGESILRVRLDRVRYERRQLGHLLFIFTAAREMDRNGVVSLVRWLSSAKASDDLVYYILTAVLSALNPTPEPENPDVPPPPLLGDGTLMVQINSALEQVQWTIPGLKACVKLQWSLWVLEVRRSDPHVQGDLTGIEKDVEELAVSAIKADAFKFAKDLVVRSKPPSQEAADLIHEIGATAELGAEEEVMEADFRPYFLLQLDALVQSVISRMSPTLRRLRTKEDDVEYAASRAMRLSMAASSTHDAAHRRNDTEALFRLIAVIFAEREPDAGLKYWRSEMDPDDQLYVFLQWAAEVKRPELTVALYEMLASLARGQECAMEAFNFLARGGNQYSGQLQAQGSCSWSTLFNALQSTADHLSKTKPAAVQVPFGRRAGTVGTISPQEVDLFRSFLRLLRNVVRYSAPAREVIRDHQSFNAIQTLFEIVRYTVPLELKAALYQTLAAFAERDGKPKGTEAVRNMWSILERTEVVRDVDGSGFNPASYELEQAESPFKQYPATVALVELFNALIYAPTRLANDQYSVASDTQTIPDMLGQNKRVPGLCPYIDFVVNDVLLKWESRGFQFNDQKYRMLDASIHFVEKCLASYDLGSLRTMDLSPAGLSNVATGSAMNPFTPLLSHPGFDILCRLLVNQSPLRQHLLNIVRDGYDAIEKNVAKSHYLNRAVRRVLHILRRVLELEVQFLGTLLPALSSNPALAGVFGSRIPRNLSPLEDYLLLTPDLVPQIAMYVNRQEDQETMLLAVDIISLISDSSAFNVIDSAVPGFGRRINRLVAILYRHESTPSIIEGFVRLLELDPDIASPGTDESLTENIPEEDTTVDLTNALRSSVMALLLQNTLPGRPAPNLAHLLLGFPLRVAPSEMTIQDPEALGSSRSCLHTVLDLVNVGVPRLNNPSQREDERVETGLPPLFERNPIFAEQCYRLIYQLSVHDFTCTPTIRYLRTREDFFARHLAALPAKASLAQVITEASGGVAVYGDQTRMPLTSKALSAFLRLRAALLECVALELHVLRETKQPQRMTRLLQLLFDTSNYVPFKPSISALETAMGGLPAPAQPLIRILEIFESLDFEWVDSIVRQQIDLMIYQDVNFDACLDVDEDGCLVYSVPLVVALINKVKRQSQKLAATMSEQQQLRLKAETRYVLESCMVENHRRQIEHAREVSFTAWRHVLDISLHECFDVLPHGQREHLILDILQALPAYLARANVSANTAMLLAEVVLSLSTKLREDRHKQLILQSTVDDSFAASLPVERIHAIFRSIVNAVLRSGTSERFRGNLYAAMTNFIHLVTADAGATESTTTPGSTLNKTISFLVDDARRDINSLALSTGRQTVVKRTALESGTLSIVNMFVDRLVPQACRDAADGSEVWKTVAFTFLDALVQLSRTEKAHRVLNVMAREGFLKNFVHSLKSSDADLLTVLKPEPEHLNPLYVYEAKMALLVRVAQTRQGSERLLDSRIFGLLGHCEFLEARPQNDHAFLDFDSFLPTAVQRYHQIIIPALQLVVSILSASGQAPTVLKQALDFVLTQRKTILALLTDYWDHLTLSRLKDLQLLVSLCSFVLPAVDDLLSPTSYGAIHTAVLSLSARCMSPRRWRDSVVAASDVEEEEAQTPAKGYGKDQRDSVWSEKVDKAAAGLQKWLAIYSMNVTELKGDFKPVIAPVVMTNSVEIGNTASHIRSPQPSISDAISALSSVVEKFVEVQERTQIVATKLDSPNQIGAEEIDEITETSYAEFMEELDMNQRRVLALRELHDAWERGQREAFDLLHWLEVLLLLLWRHLDYFTSNDRDHQSSGLGLGRSLNFSRSALQVSQGAGLKDQVGKELQPILHQLDELVLQQDVLGVESSSRKMYLQLVCRRLRESISKEDDFGASVRISLATHSHSVRPTAVDREFIRPARGRQGLYVGNINPTTNYELLRETFKTLPAFAGFRMTRHPTAPVGFIQFKTQESAIIAHQRLKHTKVVVEGRQLDVRYAKPRQVHPNSQPLMVDCDPGDESGPRPSAPAVGPTNALLVRPKTMQSTLVPRTYLKTLLEKLPGFRALRFHFDSAMHATRAMKDLQATGKLKQYIILYASAKTERAATNHLLLRVSVSDPGFDKAWKKALSLVPGYLKLRRLTPHQESLDDLWVAKFDSIEAAQSALDQVEANPNLGRFMEASFFVDNKDQDQDQVQPTPSKALYISNIAQEASRRDLAQALSLFEGFQGFILAKPSGTQEDPNLPAHRQGRLHAGWAIADFQTVDDAREALARLNGMNLSGKPLKASFKNTDPSASKSKAQSAQPPAVVTNVLFCRELFGVTPDELHMAFAKYDGFQRALLYPDGKGGYMPYGKITFDSSTSASKALEALTSQPIKIGRSDLPIVVEPLRLQRGTRHWKWTRLMR
ncbi:hypothetical protein FRC04_007391 [Tulasnella sp. 424]|nr:hypothetical protein FRC04_007391 [Tulasnella sp. 424]KAG8966458.1 hypothetical protein FRC05_002650 [Tulasnella sp. 425]